MKISSFLATRGGKQRDYGVGLQVGSEVFQGIFLSPESPSDPPIGPGSPRTLRAGGAPGLALRPRSPAPRGSSINIRTIKLRRVCSVAAD